MTTKAVRSVEDIVEELSVRYKISKNKVYKAVFSQYKFVAKIMKEGNYESVRVRKWGLYHVKPYRLKKMKEYERRQNETTSEGGG